MSSYEECIKEGEVEVETINHIKRAELPEYMGNNVDIVI